MGHYTREDSWASGDCSFAFIVSALALCVTCRKKHEMKVDQSESWFSPQQPADMPFAVKRQLLR